MHYEFFQRLGMETIKKLEAENGIVASARSEAYGCVFGRDSLITGLKLLSAYEKHPDEYILNLVQKILSGVALLQGRTINLESGEEPGKIIHEYRPDDHARLTARKIDPWYVYPDGVMRIYDSVDSTPLFLVLSARYATLAGDRKFLDIIAPSARSALQWLFDYGDKNGDGFFDYGRDSLRTHGGCFVQSWMDSNESLFHEDADTAVTLPVAAVEVQGYAYAALRMWGELLRETDVGYAVLLTGRADKLKRLFNEKFLSANPQGKPFIASGIDGAGKQIRAIRSSVGHLLWLVAWDTDGKPDSILDTRHVPLVVERLMQPDMFEPQAGIRTLSALSNRFAAYSYHNGSIWPHDTSIIAEGFENFGYHEEARLVRLALFAAFAHFKTPLELFVYDNGAYAEFNAEGHVACREQAWSAATMIADALALAEDQKQES